MSRSQYSDQQRMAALCQVAAGIAIADVCAALGISRRTLYRWKGQLGGPKPVDDNRVAGLERENRLLQRHIVAAAAEIERLREHLSDCRQHREPT